MSAWTSDELERVGGAEELELAPVGVDGRPRRPVTIWVVRRGDELYVRAVSGRSSSWFRAARARHEARIAAGGVEKDALLVETDEAGDEIDAAYRAKYRRYPERIVGSVVTPRARAATLRVVARSPEIREDSMHITRNDSDTNDGPSDWFTGSVYLDPVAAPSERSRLSATSVHFTPGARTAWHTHPRGQTIYVLEGVGLAQRRGGPIEVIRPGDRVFFEPGEDHWHGAAPNRFMTHLAMLEVDERGTSATWGEHVTDAEYGAAPAT